MAASAPGKERRWLLIYNCVHAGLGNCLRLLSPNLHVDSINIEGYRARAAEFAPHLPGYDLVVTHQDYARKPESGLDAAVRVRALPYVHFDAYHPDMCHVSTSAGELLKGPMGGFQSKIVLAAYMKGLPRGQVEGLFHRRNFEQFGYFDFWAPARARLLRGFANHDCALDARFAGWGAHGAFMHSSNHPAIRVVRDIAVALLESEGEPVWATPLMPPDDLLNGPVFPVYPEVAEQLSSPGSYLFKLPSEFRNLDLGQFIAASWESLSGHDPGSLKLGAMHAASFEQVLARL